MEQCNHRRIWYTKHSILIESNLEDIFEMYNTRANKKFILSLVLFLICISKYLKDYLITVIKIKCPFDYSNRGLTYDEENFL